MTNYQLPMTDDQSFKGQVALLTGAASGLGAAVAAKLLAAGATVVVADLKASALPEAVSVLLDVTKEEAVAATVQQLVAQYGKIDILINCAGITGITNRKSEEVDTANLRAVFEVNFMGSFFTSKYVLPVMRERGYGRILHFASISGKEGNAGMLAYSASKAAVIGMAKVQGKEYAETGVTVNAIAPAVIHTPLLDGMPEAQLKYMTDKIPMKRTGTLDELAEMAVFIVSKANSFTTGFVFDLSGGRATY